MTFAVIHRLIISYMVTSGIKEEGEASDLVNGQH